MMYVYKSPWLVYKPPDIQKEAWALGMAVFIGHLFMQSGPSNDVKGHLGKYAMA